MCDPATALSTGAAVVGTGLQIVSSFSKQGEKQAQFVQGQDYIRQVATNTNESLAQFYNGNNARVVQENDKAATESFDIVRGLAQAKGAATAAAGDAGVGGVSFANIISDLEMRTGLARGVGDYNYATKVQQVADENLAARKKADTQIATAVNMAPGAPNPFNPWAEIGSSAVSNGLKIADAFGVFDKKKPEPRPITTTGATYGNEFEV